MASHMWNRRQALEKEVKDLYVKISIAGSGAPTLVSGSSYGAESITRNSAGDYTLKLQDQYNSLKYFEGIVLSSSAQDLTIQLKSETVNATTRAVNFFTNTGATPTDPASGKVLVLKIEVKNTSAI